MRGYILALEVVVLVAALVTLGIVIVGRRRRPALPTTPTAWILALSLVGSGLAAVASRLWISAVAVAFYMIAVALMVVPPRSAHPTREVRRAGRVDGALDVSVVR